MTVSSFRKISHYGLCFLLAAAIATAGYYWLTQRTSSEPIYPYDAALDRAALIEIFKPNFFWLTDDPDEQHALESFEHTLDHRASSRRPGDAGDLHIYVYRDDEGTKGFVSYYRTSWSSAKILYIAVGDAYRRRGYAEKLMQFVLNEIKRQGFNHVELVTRVVNQRAQGLYKKFGFKQGWNDGTLVSFERTL